MNGTIINISVIERFLNKVSFGDVDSCWQWTGRIGHNGYGIYDAPLIAPRGTRYANQLRAHRFAYAIWIGALADGAFVCHSCDNRSCVNPWHLFLGSPSRNSKDMVSKDRQCKGERKKNARLTDEAVSEMRKLHSGGIGYKRLAKMFSVSQSCAYKATNKMTWKHVNERR